MGQAPFGLMCHCLAKPASSTTPSEITSDEWNRIVDGFNVERLAQQVRDSGAGYVMLTLGQNTGHFCAPNAAYDEIMGWKESLLSKRDLLQEVADALAPHVKTMAYLPAQAPANHEASVRAFRLMPPWGASDWANLQKFWTDEEDADVSLTEFQIKWEAITRFWSEKWGDKIAGWWIDGVYHADQMFRNAHEPNFHSFARALRAGNPSSVLAFNSGTENPVEKLTDEQDYTAGEISRHFRCHERFVPIEATTEGMQTHFLTFLGDWWGDGEPRFSAKFVAGYTQHLHERGAAMTWDVPTSWKGEIPDAHRRILEVIE
jgi:hypothetical protein